MNTTNTIRTLAIDLRADRIAYAVFDGSGKLLDIGAPRFKSPRTARVRVATLLKSLRPSMLVLRRLRPRSTRRRPRWTSSLRAIRSEAKWLGIPVAFLTEHALKAFYRGLACRNKFQVAELLAARFPQIAWKLPRPRKSYEPEPWAICYFDAVSLGVAFLALSPETPQQSGAAGILSPASK